nr:HAMP domain-containing sensor histidine kinase [uncultured Blautia sp.]
MEIKNKKKKTLTGIFAGYILSFVMLTIVWAFFCFILMFAVILTSGLGLLPANYGELVLEKNNEAIKESEKVGEELIPSGSQFGIFDQDGTFLYGSFDKKDQETAWQNYQKDNQYARGKGYYHFFQRKNGEICIVKYYIEVRYANEKLNDILPPAEKLTSWLMAGLFTILTVLSGLILSRHFAKRMKKELAGLAQVTEKIACNDLDFEVQSSNIREMEDSMRSLEKMKDALKISLQQQWEAEQSRNRQLSALAHDIKTPLTVIRGNAELLTEGELCSEDLFCVQEILKNARDIEQYLDSMRQVLKGQKNRTEQERVSCSDLAWEFKEAACRLGEVKRIPVFLETEEGEHEGEILCSRTELLRAWKNIVSNGLEHTSPGKGIRIEICEKVLEDPYLVVSVRDYGQGFSKEALIHGAEAFFSGDESRHDRKHQGLGLSIAENFMKNQGGFLEYKNVEKECGALVSLWIKKYTKQ